MPGIDGLELLARLRALESPPIVIVLTAHGSERQAVEAMKRGAADHLPKPFDADELVRRASRPWNLCGCKPRQSASAESSIWPEGS